MSYNIIIDLNFLSHKIEEGLRKINLVLGYGRCLDLFEDEKFLTGEGYRDPYFRGIILIIKERILWRNNPFEDIMCL